MSRLRRWLLIVLVMVVWTLAAAGDNPALAGADGPVEWRAAYPEAGSEGCTWWVAAWSDGGFSRLPWVCPAGVAPLRDGRPVSLAGSYPEPRDGCLWYVVAWADSVVHRLPASCQPGVRVERNAAGQAIVRLALRPPAGGFRAAADLPPLAIDAIIAGAPPPPGLDPRLLRTLVVTGDVIPARYVNVQSVRRYGFTYPWEATRELLAAGDLRFINLETPLIDGCPLMNDGLTFCGDARAVEGLRFAGIDVANLGNNHAGNFGVAGLRETTDRLDAAGIAWTGWGDNLAVRDVDGIRFAFLGYDVVGRRADRGLIQRQVGAARQRADIVVVQYHWGAEYTALPLPWPDDPRSLGKLTIDAGADLVVGNHPHWVQGVELYKDRLITYAHGNFIFDQDWSRETQDGIVGHYTFYGTRLVAVRYTPIVIWSQIQPRLATGRDAERIMRQFTDSTRALNPR